MGARDVGVEEFDRVLAEEKRPVLVDFWGTWCAPCRAMPPHLDRFADSHESDAEVVAVNIEKFPELADRFEVQSTPTLVLFREGRAVRRFTGATLPGELEEELYRTEA
jgi:thioredoxin 1